MHDYESEADLYRYGSEEEPEDSKNEDGGLNLYEQDREEEAERHSYTQLTNADTAYRTYIVWQELDVGDLWPADFWRRDKRDYYQHLDDMNKGIKNGPSWRNGPYDTYLSNRDLIGIVADELGLTVRQRGAVESYFLSLKLGLSKELVAASACLYIVHSDDRDERQCHPDTAEATRDEIFYDAIEKYGLWYKDMKKTYFKVQHDFDSRQRRGRVHKPLTLLRGEESPEESDLTMSRTEHESDGRIRDWSTVKETLNSKNALFGVA